MPSTKKRSRSYTTKNRVKLIRAGHPYFSLLTELINQAAYSIHLQVYIFDNDETGAAVGEALIEAANRGVNVYIVADGFASKALSSAFIVKLRKAGINFKYFEPLFRSKSFYFGRRLHHKITVVDGKYSLVGGINISNCYNDLPGAPSWLDYALYTEGEAAVQLFKLCNEFWENTSVTLPVIPAETHELIQSISEKDLCSVKVCHNDWVKLNNQIWKSYFDLFNQASQSIIIICSYFLPGWELLNKLSKAAKRGVKIKVILAGPSDVMLAKYAERYLYKWMLNRGIRIFEYQPAVLHAKMAVADDHWVNIGSYNINDISAIAGIETNLYVRNKPFAQQIRQELDKKIEEDCIEITLKTHKISWIGMLWQRMAYQIIKLFINLFTFYFKRRL